MKKMFGRFSGRAVVSFLVSLIFCGTLISAVIFNRAHIEKLEIEQTILEKSVRINEVISKLLYKTQALSVIVIQGNGDVHNFDQIASTIVADDAVILNVLLAPNGIVSKVYPLNGNESVIGWNFFGEGEGNIEAQAARDSGGLVVGGPFNVVQGGQALVGRLPVYIDTPDETGNFWGLVSVTLKFPQILEDVGLEIFHAHGLAYELWRINPDTNEEQVIAYNDEHTRRKSHFFEREIHIINAVWFLKVWPAYTWYSRMESWIFVVIGFFICFLVLFVVQNNFELRQMKTIFEQMAKIDPVTGIYNRRYLDENIKRFIISLSRSNGTLSLLMVDVDFFKNYNDAYGHSKGDICLKTIAEVLGVNLLRTDDFVARYGGEEFVVVLPNTSERGARMVADRLLESIRKRGIPHEASSVAEYVTISIGVTTGAVLHTYSGDNYIQRADKAMYMSKQNGRNMYTFLQLL
ncbi:MAG: diguanylate cyclase [Treponema sp.]|jgi:diguanylate cyclase (GGDEF)-like protein|nr:diguanylate cyclase [Treponema sp.]